MRGLLLLFWSRHFALCGSYEFLPTCKHPAQAFLDRGEVTERVLSVLKNFEKVNQSKLTATSHFLNDLGLDSLDAVEVGVGRLHHFCKVTRSLLASVLSTRFVCRFAWLLRRSS
jgi:hypothetical protein